MSSGEMGPGPPDEIEALRAILLAELRRRPGDLPTLMRKAEVIAKMIADQGRISPQRKAQMRANVMQLFDQMGITLKPEEEGEGM